MWRTYTENNTLAYSFIQSMVAMHPYYIARAIGGGLFLTGGVIGFYNVWKTVQQASRMQRELAGDKPVVVAGGAEALQAGE